MSCKTTSSIRELEAATMGRALWVRRLNREIINNFPLRMKGDVINNKHPRYYNPTHGTPRWSGEMLRGCHTHLNTLVSRTYSLRVHYNG
jgi:hypothetical protein